MFIGGLQKFSLLDYPDHLSAIIFTQGCNFRCQFCYNPMLVWPACPTAYASSGRSIRHGKSKNKNVHAPQGVERKGHPILREDDLFLFLKKRVGKLDAVVITGGEPTLQPDVGKFIFKIKKMGFLVKLDTNGTNPDVLAKLIKARLIDYIAMDIKTSLENYPKVTDRKTDLNNIKKSVKLVLGSKVPYEFRTTVVPGLIDQSDIEKIGRIIKGADKWYLQKFKSDTPLVNKGLIGGKSYSRKETEELAQIGRKYAKKCEVR